MGVRSGGGERLPAQAALIASLLHPEYVWVDCGSLDNLPIAFAELDEQVLERTTPYIAQQPGFGIAASGTHTGEK
jgi:hypothetical protein